MEDIQQKSLKERLAELENEVIDGKRKTKPFKIPFKGRLNKKKVKDGYVMVVTIQDNKNIDFTKERIVDGTVKLHGQDLSFHAIEPEDVFFYKNKPLIFQPKKKLNPFNPLKGTHETYGQKYIMARMEGDKIALKKSLGWGASIIGIVVLGIIAYAFITGGGA